MVVAEITSPESSGTRWRLKNRRARKWRLVTRSLTEALHAPAHLDADVLSALGRLHRAGDLEAEDVESKLRDLVAAPIQRHGVDDLVIGAWSRRHQLRLVDALYVRLAIVRDLRLVTTDRRL